MQNLKQVLLAIMLVISTNANANPAKPPSKPQKTITIKGEINDQVIEKFQADLNSVTKNSNVALVINSDGGNPSAYFLFKYFMAQTLKNNIKVRCYVREKASSAAAFVLSLCHERFIIGEARVLWHAIYSIVPASKTNTKADLEFISELYYGMLLNNAIIVSDMTSILGITVESYVGIFDRELSGLEINKLSPEFIKCLDNSFKVIKCK